eukprot:7383733-Prymnesium_polylepis.1
MALVGGVGGTCVVLCLRRRGVRATGPDGKRLSPDRCWIRSDGMAGLRPATCARARAGSRFANFS